LTPGNGGGSGRIAFTCHIDLVRDTSDVCVSQLDGSQQKRLTRSAWHASTPAWSPDGKHLVFRLSEPNNPDASDVWIMNDDGSGQRNLTNAPNESNWGATWSPDGRILFNSGRTGGMPQLYLMNADGSGRRLLFPALNLWQEYAAWSRDGKKVAFMSHLSGTSSAFVIYIINADGSGLQQVTHGPGEDGEPLWSPDSSRLIYTSYQKSGSIYSVQSNGSGLQQLVRSPAGFDCHADDWSPDGTKILFGCSQAGATTGELWVMNADGSGQTRLLTFQEPNAGSAVYQP
jgi:TolB protein